MSDIQLPYWDSKDCIFGFADRCLVRDELSSFAIKISNLTAPPAQCTTFHARICFEKAAPSLATPIFSFSVFVTALTLMAVVFSITDVRFRFRVSVVPGPFVWVSTVIVFVIGACVLLSDLAANLGWQVPRAVNSDAVWQAIAGGNFFCLFLSWVLVGYLAPPKFGRLNAGKFNRAISRVILTGNNSEITTIAQELAQSVARLVKLCPTRTRRNIWWRPRWAGRYLPRIHWAQNMLLTLLRRILGEVWFQHFLEPPPTITGRHAWTILSLMGSRRFCHAVVAGAPITAIAVFQEVAKQRKYDLPLRQFSINVSQEAVLNYQSLLYHEDGSSASAALAHWKPFSAAVYGNYELVEGLGRDNGSPLDIGYFDRQEWTALQFHAYTRVTLITFRSYLAGGHWGEHSFALVRAIGTISEIAGKHNFDLAKTSGDGSVTEKASEMLRTGVRFLEDAIAVLNELPQLPRRRTAKTDRNNRFPDMYDELAKLGYSLFQGASWVRSETASWSIQQNVVWSQLFGIGQQSRAWRIVQRKIRFLIRAEVEGKFFSYVTARVFGMAINVVGFHAWAGENRPEAVLRVALTRWAREHLMKQYKENSELVESGLPANIKLDAATRRLYRTYPKGIQPKPHIVYLQLS